MNKFLKSIAIVLLTLACVGCMSSNVKWRQSNLPDNKDNWVRFKTTYYFRVVNTCEPPKPKVLSNIPNSFNDEYILSDTLHRFNLTGKAHHWSNTKFESGTLHASQIDPFGSSVKINEGEFELVSKNSLSHDETKSEQFLKLKSINTQVDDIYSKLKSLKEDDKKDQPLIAEYKSQLVLLLESRRNIFEFLYGASEKGSDSSRFYLELNVDNKAAINDLNSKALKVDPLSYGGSDKLVYLNTAQMELVKNTELKDQVKLEFSRRDCPPGFSRNHGFLVLGPEGWRHFNPDERLILAMYTSAKPLISTMTELSSRMANAHSEVTPASQPFNDEISNVTNSELKFHRSDNSEAFDVRLDKLIKAIQGTDKGSE
ncbi:MAG: hypothetical protein GY829_10785 [Gammaproteobacteria bacterium]|nr:hypothetical protein [Gammaproteobacteria bacterium]